MTCPPESVADWLLAQWPALWRTAQRYRRLGRGVEDAEDVLLVAAARVWQHWHTHDPATGPRIKWARRILRNAAIDVLRRERGRDGADHRPPESLDRWLAFDAPDAAFEAIDPDPAIDPAAAALAADAQARADALLAQATPEQARALRLRLEGYPFDQIGRQVGSNEDAAKRLVSRARQRLRRFLAAQPPHPAGHPPASDHEQTHDPPHCGHRQPPSHREEVPSVTPE